MLIAFVTTVRRSRSASTRATSVVVVPPVRPTARPSCTSSPAASGDAALLVGVLRASVAQRQLVGDAARDRATVRAREQALLLEQLEVAANGGLGHVERARQVGDTHTAMGSQVGEDRVETLRLAHGRAR